MENLKLTVTKEFTFHAAHRLYFTLLDQKANESLFGKCSKLHGHSYRLKVTVSRSISIVKKSDDKMVVNFSTLKDIVNSEIISKVDHTVLNDLDMFQGISVLTAEAMLITFWDILAPALETLGLQLEELVLYETDTCSATLRRS